MTSRPDQPFWARLSAADAALSARLALSSRPLRLLAHLIAHSGDSLLWLMGTAIIFFAASPDWHPFVIWVWIATFSGGTAAALLKLLFRRGRPSGPADGLYIQSDRHSFPSGHATRVACMTVLLAPLLPSWTVALMVIWAVLVPLARVALQIHYLADVAGGFVVGSSVGLILRAIL